MNKILTAGLLALAFTMSPISAQMWGSSAADTSAEKPPVDTSKVENKPAPAVVPATVKDETPPVVTPKADETAPVVTTPKSDEAKDDTGAVKATTEKKDDSGCPAAAAAGVDQAK